jgi:hypothetical protein
VRTDTKFCLALPTPLGFFILGILQVIGAIFQIYYGIQLIRVYAYDLGYYTSISIRTTCILFMVAGIISLVAAIFMSSAGRISIRYWLRIDSVESRKLLVFSNKMMTTSLVLDFLVLVLEAIGFS